MTFPEKSNENIGNFKQLLGSFRSWEISKKNDFTLLLRWPCNIFSPFTIQLKTLPHISLRNHQKMKVIFPSSNLAASAPNLLSNYNWRIPLTQTQSPHIIMRVSHHPLLFLNTFISFCRYVLYIIRLLLNHSQQHLDNCLVLPIL